MSGAALGADHERTGRIRRPARSDWSHGDGKPNSVPAGEPASDGHSSRIAVADDLVHATRPRSADNGRSPKRAEDCLRLHPVGFAVPRLSPAGRCALTAPFHPYLRRPEDRNGRFVFCGTFPCPRPGPVGVTHHRVLWCSDFPPTGSGEPAPAGDHLSPTTNGTPESGRGIARAVHCRGGC